jgi:hypothetical protein
MGIFTDKNVPSSFPTNLILMQQNQKPGRTCTKLQVMLKYNRELTYRSSSVSFSSEF